DLLLAHQYYGCEKYQPYKTPQINGKSYSLEYGHLYFQFHSKRYRFLLPKIRGSIRRLENTELHLPKYSGWLAPSAPVPAHIKVCQEYLPQDIAPFGITNLLHRLSVPAPILQNQPVCIQQKEQCLEVDIPD